MKPQMQASTTKNSPVNEDKLKLNNIFVRRTSNIENRQKPEKLIKNNHQIK